MVLLKIFCLFSEFTVVKLSFIVGEKSNCWCAVNCNPVVQNFVDYLIGFRDFNDSSCTLSTVKIIDMEITKSTTKLLLIKCNNLIKRSGMRKPNNWLSVFSYLSGMSQECWWCSAKKIWSGNQVFSSESYSFLFCKEWSLSSIIPCKRSNCMWRAALRYLFESLEKRSLLKTTPFLSNFCSD